jgi:hypothetical protein
MKQVVRAGLPCDVCTGVARLQREMGTVPIVAFSEVEIEVMYFLHEGRLYTGMLHQELVKESGATLLRSDDEKVGQRSYWSSSQSPEMPGSICLLDAALHNPSFLSQMRTYYKPMEDTISGGGILSRLPAVAAFGICGGLERQFTESPVMMQSAILSYDFIQYKRIAKNFPEV